jgi:hypothetical protein
MAWIASLLLFAVLGAGAIGIAMYRRSIRADDIETRELPPDVLIALGRANDAALGDRGGPERDPDGAEPS